MSKHIFLFLGTFVLGALIALTVRAARVDRSDLAAAPTSAAASVAPAAPASLAPSHDHSAHKAHDIGAKAASAPVNTVCAICGMDVDPDLPTATYQGKTIGFGCKACPPKFAKEPDRFGPAALRNEVVE